MRHLISQTLVRTLRALVLAVGASSCSLPTIDCGGPSVRQTFGAATIRDLGDTLSVDAYASLYEELDKDGKYLHSLAIGIQATDLAHNDTIPSALRPHVIGARLELAGGQIVYHVSMSNNLSQRYGPPVLAVIYSNGVNQTIFDNIRSHLLAQDLSIVIEPDSPEVQFPRGLLVVRDSYDWRKTSGCK